MWLWQSLATENASRCRTSTTMDIKYVQGRIEHEGLSFLTITLPNFGKDTQKCLDQGYVDRSLFTGFQWKGGLPRFLGGFLDLVFDRSSGLLLDEPSVDAILALRQLTLLFGKILLPCSDARVKKAMDDYIKCEQDVRKTDKLLSPIKRRDFKRISNMLFAEVFAEADYKISQLELLPKHGPGSTADKLIGNEKYDQRSWTARLQRILPYGEMILPNLSYLEESGAIDILEPEAEMPVKVITVPKTLKTPRIIAIEPTAMQYAQQGVLHLLLNALNKDKTLSRIIDLANQESNQILALEGSITTSTATLDLSEASDRVSNQQVRDMLSDFPHLHEAVDACRSRKADVPGHGVIRLAKFASMGSALCFPFEAMVFTTLIFMGIEEELNRPLSFRDVKRLSRKVRVYGDDIIVPVEFVPAVVRMLQTFGSVVNTSKSFWTGRFRESCGKEYYAGQDVSIVKVREVLPAHRQDAPRIISLVSLRNQLYFAGYWQTCAVMDEYIRDLIKHFPVVDPSSQVQGRHSFLGYTTERMCDRLHAPLVKGYVVSARIPQNSVDDKGALLKYFLKRGDLPIADRRHLERSGRPSAVDIKLRYASPF
jgi:hypothetical protein